MNEPPVCIVHRTPPTVHSRAPLLPSSGEPAGIPGIFLEFVVVYFAVELAV